MRLTQIRGFLLVFSFSIVCLMTGCNWGSSGSGGGAPVGGFFVYTVDQLVVGGVGLPPTPILAASGRVARASTLNI
jgi:hypothetical protein